jgi:hypothetical protein
VPARMSLDSAPVKCAAIQEKVALQPNPNWQKQSSTTGYGAGQEYSSIWGVGEGRKRRKVDRFRWLGTNWFENFLNLRGKPALHYMKIR